MFRIRLVGGEGDPPTWLRIMPLELVAPGGRKFKSFVCCPTPNPQEAHLFDDLPKAQAFCEDLAEALRGISCYLGPEDPRGVEVVQVA